MEAKLKQEYYTSAGYNLVTASDCSLKLLILNNPTARAYIAKRDAYYAYSNTNGGVDLRE